MGVFTSQGSGGYYLISEPCGKGRNSHQIAAASVAVRRAPLNQVAATSTSEEMSREVRGRRERSRRTREQKSGNHGWGSVWTGGHWDRASENEEHVTLGKTGTGRGKAWGQRSPKELVSCGVLATVTSSVAGLGERREK